ncbi:MAG: hydrogen gas-evolving membrane-bound hydrogenase subunit E [Actinomycetota bacterium]
MSTLLALHLAAALAAVPLVRRAGPRGLLVLAAVPGAVLLWVATTAPRILDGAPVEERIGWAPDLGFEIAVRVDSFSLVMVLLVSGIGALIFAYGFAYFGERPDLGRLASLLMGFSGAMLGLVVTDNLLAIFLFWEATSITSYLLIGNDDRSAAARSAALRALLTTGVGGLAMLAGFVLLAQEAGSWSLTQILADPPRGAVVEVALVLVLLGAFTKSAQVPFHFWLPGAMAAPTPVSAYLHSATMVKAGVYLIARFAPPFAEVGVWRPMVISVGLATMLLGGWRALAQHDLKLLLAHGTTSQLGLLVVLLGAGYPEATLAGVVLLLAHGAYKAALFMVVGIIEKAAGTRDIRKLTGLHRPLRTTLLVAAVAAGSMAGVPPMLGFVAKEATYEAALGSGLAMAGLVVALLVAGSALTFAYSARALWGAFAHKGPLDLEDGTSVGPVSGAGLRLVLPAAVLAALAVALGAAPTLVEAIVVSGAQAIDPDVPPAHLRLWHGFNAPLTLSAITIGAGALLWVARHRLERLQQMVHVPPSGARTFDLLLRNTVRAADRVTGALQTGSLPVYLLIILTTVLVVPGTFLLVSLDLPSELLLVDRPVQVAVAAAMVVATVGAIRTRHRLGAVMAVGAVGYGVAVLFIIQGAPDLALTQLMIETLLLVLFVLVLRHLPRRFTSAQTALPTAPRAVLAVLVGLFAAVFAMVAVGARPDLEPVSVEYLARSLPEADGRNIVNTILVDFRAFDTLGEIVVLTVAGLGVIGLVRAASRERVPQPTRPGPIRQEPSLILDRAVRALFHTVITFSVVLLLIGHNEPGGGFIGGLVAGAAFMLVYLAGGTGRLQRAEPLNPELFLGLGISLAALAGLFGWLSGGEFLEASHISFDVPLLGGVKLATVLLFDGGVYLVVVGLVVALLRSLGQEDVRGGSPQASSGAPR